MKRAPEVRSRKSRSNYQGRNDVLFAFKTDVLICLNVKQEGYQFAKQNALVRRQSVEKVLRPTKSSLHTISVV